MEKCSSGGGGGGVLALVDADGLRKATAQVLRQLRCETANADDWKVCFCVFYLNS